MLEGLGLEVTEATDAPEAISLLGAEAFALVVSDYQMPNGTGLDLAEVARASATPFILLTGVGGNDSFDDDRLGLVAAHLTKPVSTGELADAVDRVLGPDRTADEEASWPEAPVDQAVLRALSADLGDEQVTVSVVVAFLAELDARCEELISALVSGPEEQARRHAHTLASPSATVGAVGLAATCRAVELGRAPDRLYATLPALAATTRQGLEQWLRTAGAAHLLEG
jgi:CheY-like chemotaxis protein/HPt (histidine-containing phosphotransfer) domain-containing protein